MGLNQLDLGCGLRFLDDRAGDRSRIQAREGQLLALPGRKRLIRFGSQEPTFVGRPEGGGSTQSCPSSVKFLATTRYPKHPRPFGASMEQERCTSRLGGPLFRLAAPARIRLRAPGKNRVPRGVGTVGRFWENGVTGGKWVAGDWTMSDSETEAVVNSV